MVDVRIFITPTDLRMPNRSLVDGSPDATLVTACVLSSRFKPVRVPMSVDRVTGRRMRWLRLARAFLAFIAIPSAALFGLATITVVLIGPVAPLFVLCLLATILACTAMIGSGAAAFLLQPRTYPRWISANEILIPAVDRSVAEEWQGLNSDGAISVGR